MSLTSNKLTLNQEFYTEPSLDGSDDVPIPFIPSLLSNNKHLLLSRLLPYDSEVKVGKRLKDGLKEYLLLLTALEIVIKEESKGAIDSFDPLVGENACQIRALKLAFIFSKKPAQDESILPEVLLKKLKCRACLDNPENLIQKNYSLKDLLLKGNLEVRLTSRELFLVQSYLLTHVKVLRPPREENPLVKNEYTDTKKIKEISSVGSMFADNLVKRLREDVACSSVNFVQEIASQLGSEWHNQMVSTEFVTKHRNLQCLPCFWTTQILMFQALNYHIPVIILAKLKVKDRGYEVIQDVSLFFKATPEGYKAVDASKLNHNSPAIVLVGNGCEEFKSLPNLEEWKKKLSELGPIHLMLAYAATHRQYPNSEFEDKVQSIDDNTFSTYKAKAQEWGCNLENPSCFFLAHAYCDFVGNIDKQSTKDSKKLKAALIPT